MSESLFDQHPLSDFFPLIIAPPEEKPINVHEIRDSIKTNLQQLATERQAYIERTVSEYDRTVYFPMKRQLRAKCADLTHVMAPVASEPPSLRLVSCTVCGIIRSEAV